ncbi:hypothetical protein C7446_2937 [Kushneria sinocarnis]|uniref:Hemerythrin-like domain-containing protein n=1 Tax=Kushneria sinocarnis TaxID=595502 RepID=A0A420WTH3_9GAMM|nr:hemerythrin domain-containing protein [Kushneria sinocarnis]RKQ96345.1 hypothetical protein C7446_2937 [Kushneria sinocarnis]
MLDMSQLRQDHANMARLLHVLLQRHRMLAEGERPDFRMMREVLDYILAYMDEYIVPLERLCSERLVERDSENGALVFEAANDYRALKNRLNRLSNDLDMILMDAIVPMAQFAESLKAYVDAHRHYLRLERERLFPLIERHFDDQEYQHLRNLLPGDARVRVEQLQQDYPSLYAEFREAQVVLP